MYHSLGLFLDGWVLAPAGAQRVQLPQSNPDGCTARALLPSHTYLIVHSTNLKINTCQWQKG